MEMAGLQGLAVVQKILESLIPRFGSSSEIGDDVLKALKIINKHVQAGAVSPAGMNNEFMNQMRRHQQGQAQLAQMQQRMQQPPQAAAQPPSMAAGPAAMAA